MNKMQRRYSAILLVSGLFTLFFFSRVPVTQATPPLDVQLSYSLEDKSLAVKIKHTSHDLNEHFIRKIAVYINGEEADVKHFRRQSDPYEFTVHFSLSAKPGDTFKAIAYCEKGGSKEGILAIEEESKTDEQPSTDSSPSEGLEQKNEAQDSY